MFPLRCTVRNCENLLVRVDAGLSCPSRHHFDRAKEGYWSLLQPQDRKSKNPGDSDEAVLARQRWLGHGHMAGLTESLRPWVAKRDHSLGVFDLGCGEGTFGASLFGAEPETYCGIDLSKRAIKLAARRWPEATWVLCNADRELPAADQSVGCVLSLFGRRPAEEIDRVLSTNGICIVAVPGEDDLIELREHVQQHGHRRSRWESVCEQLTECGLSLIEHRKWQHQASLSREAIADALAMTYRAVRHSEQARAETLHATDVTLSADLLLLAKAGS